MNRAICVICVICGFSPAVRGDWPNFRGPNHDGISQETGIKFEWKDPIPHVWDRKVGSSFSSFACVGNRVYTSGTQDEKQVLLCLDADTGKVIWQVPFEKEYPERMGGDGPRATPTVSEGRVYMLGARGLFFCADAENGKELWRHQFDHIPQWGYSASVLIEGNMAITTAGKNQGALVAFDKLTGKELWKAGDDPAGYATPYPFTFESKRYILGFTGTSAIIVEPASGRTVLKMPWQTSYEVNAAQPIFHDGHLFLTSGYETGSGLFKLKTVGDKLVADEVWKSKVLLSKFQSSIFHKGKIYGSDQTSLVCADFMTGKEEWRKKRMANGTMVLVSEHLILLTEQGKLEIAKASPEGWNPITAADILSDRCWSVPVLHRGRLYARNIDHVMCFDMRAK